MTVRAPLDRDTARSLELFAAEIDDIATEHNATRGEILQTVIEGFEERIAKDSANLAFARRLEDLDRMPVETSLETAIDIVARGGGHRRRVDRHPYTRKSLPVFADRGSDRIDFADVVWLFNNL